MQRVRILNGVLIIMLMNSLLVSSPLFAQQATQQTTEPAQETEQQAASDELAENSEEQTESDLPDIDTQPIQAGSGGPGRFIPSEQISQDLGVSFPVDI